MANSEWLFCWKNWLPSLNTRLTLFTSYSLFFYEDAEGFAREIGVICIPGVENELKFVALK